MASKMKMLQLLHRPRHKLSQMVTSLESTPRRPAWYTMMLSLSIRSITSRLHLGMIAEQIPQQAHLAPTALSTVRLVPRLVRKSFLRVQHLLWPVRAGMSHHSLPKLPAQSSIRVDPLRAATLIHFQSRSTSTKESSRRRFSESSNCRNQLLPLDPLVAPSRDESTPRLSQRYSQETVDLGHKRHQTHQHQKRNRQPPPGGAQHAP